MDYTNPGFDRMYYMSLTVALNLGSDMIWYPMLSARLTGVDVDLRSRLHFFKAAISSKDRDAASKTELGSLIITPPICNSLGV